MKKHWQRLVKSCAMDGNELALYSLQSIMANDRLRNRLAWWIRFRRRWPVLSFGIMFVLMLARESKRGGRAWR